MSGLVSGLQKFGTQHSWWGWANGFSAYIEYFQIQRGNQVSLLDAQQLLN
jgi:hypothetical protein